MRGLFWIWAPLLAWQWSHPKSRPKTSGTLNVAFLSSTVTLATNSVVLYTEKVTGGVPSVARQVTMAEKLWESSFNTVKEMSGIDTLSEGVRCKRM